MAAFLESFHPLSMLVQEFAKKDEDVFDRLSHMYTTLLFFVLAAVVTCYQFIGESIKCLTPAHFTDAWTEYTNAYCWVANTYYVPMSEADILDESRREHIVYYQWVPIALFVQAAGFYLPSVVWACFKNALGFNAAKIAALLTRAESLNPQSRDDTNKFLVKHFDRALHYSQQSGEDVRCGARTRAVLARAGCLCGKSYGNGVVAAYLLSKILYIANAFGQLYALKFFLGTDYVLYGYEALRELSAGGSVRESARFPRVTLCDMETRALGQNRWYTVQCALPVNLFYEKMYVVIWFWLAMVALVSVIGLFLALSELFLSSRRSFVKRYLKSSKDFERSAESSAAVNGFCVNYLKHDGHFVLRLIAKNTNDLTVGELIVALWKQYMSFRAKKKDREAIV